MIPSTPKIRYSDHEFLEYDDKNPENFDLKTGVNLKRVSAFLMLHGASRWNDLKLQFARQRIISAADAALLDSVGTMTESQYAQHRDAIQRAQSLPPKSKPVYGEVPGPDLPNKGFEGHRLYLETFGSERYFQALGVSPALDDEGFHQAEGRDFVPYKAVSE